MQCNSGFMGFLKIHPMGSPCREVWQFYFLLQWVLWFAWQLKSCFWVSVILGKADQPPKSPSKQKVWRRDILRQSWKWHMKNSHGVSNDYLYSLHHIVGRVVLPLTTPAEVLKQPLNRFEAQALIWHKYKDERMGRKIAIKEKQQIRTTNTAGPWRTW